MQELGLGIYGWKDGGDVGKIYGGIGGKVILKREELAEFAESR